MRSSHRSSRRQLLPAILLLVLSPSGGSLRAQAVRFELAPSVTRLSNCLGDDLDVAVRLSNPGEFAVAGYQIFISFPADHFEVVGYEPLAIGSFVHVAAPEPLGNGFVPCTEPRADSWSDGRGVDRVAVIASGFGPGGDGTTRERDLVLGRLAFRARGVPTSESPGEFSFSEEVCHEPFSQDTLAFGPDGTRLASTFAAAVEVSVEDVGPAVDGFGCTSRRSGVLLQWFVADTSGFTGYRIYRDDEVLVTLPTVVATSFEDTSPPTGFIRYEIAVLTAAGESCRTACSLEREAGAAFIRGDANRDGWIDVSDAVALLNHLFRESPMTCDDAGDADDSGRLNLTDVLVILNFLVFPLEAAVPPDPFDEAGPDPTEDALGCEE